MTKTKLPGKDNHKDLTIYRVVRYPELMSKSARLFVVLNVSKFFRRKRQNDQSEGGFIFALKN